MTNWDELLFNYNTIAPTKANHVIHCISNWTIVEWNYSSVGFQLGPIYVSFNQTSWCKAVMFAQYMQYLSSLQQNGSLECKRRWGNSVALLVLWSNSLVIQTCLNSLFPHPATWPTYPPAYQLSDRPTDGDTIAICGLVLDRSFHSRISI